MRANDNKIFNIGDYVRLSKEYTKEMKQDKFLKLSMLQNWTDEIYKIESRNGPNTWRIINLDGTQPKKEIKIWLTSNLLKVDDAAARAWAELSTKPVKQQNNYVHVKTAKLKRQLELEIPKEEKAKQLGDLNTRTTRQSKMTTRAKKKPIEPIEPEFEVSELLESKVIRKKQF